MSLDHPVAGTEVENPMRQRKSDLIWEVANRAMAAMLRNPAFSTVPAEDVVAACFRTADLMFDAMNEAFPDDESSDPDSATRRIH